MVYKQGAMVGADALLRPDETKSAMILEKTDLHRRPDASGQKDSQADRVIYAPISS
jgi:hypothetical protein